MRVEEDTIQSELFGGAIQARRWDLELTQERVEREARLPRGFISYVECNRRKTLPPPGQFRRLCAALKLGEADMLVLSGYISWSAKDLDYLEDLAQTLAARPGPRKAA